MGDNSIRVNLSKEDIISDINLMQGASSPQQRVCIVVEGRDDIVFFQSRMKSDVNLYESFSGCVGVREIIEFFCMDNVIGICDHDYDNTYTNEHIFFYDYNCLEMMLVSSDSVFDSVCATCYTGSLPFSELRIQILNDLKLISILRIINFDDKMGINFNKISISNLYNKQSKKIDITKIQNTLQSSILLDKRTEIARLKLDFTTYEHLLHITNGHDFTSYLQLLFAANRPPKTKALGVEMIFLAMSIAYRKEEFACTYLYQSLKGFESMHCIEILN